MKIVYGIGLILLAACRPTVKSDLNSALSSSEMLREVSRRDVERELALYKEIHLVDLTIRARQSHDVSWLSPKDLYLKYFFSFELKYRYQARPEAKSLQSVTLPLSHIQFDDVQALEGEEEIDVPPIKIVTNNLIDLIFADIKRRDLKFGNIHRILGLNTVIRVKLWERDPHSNDHVGNIYLDPTQTIDDPQLASSRIDATDGSHANGHFKLKGIGLGDGQ